jgi:hypothetical protein
MQNNFTVLKESIKQIKKAKQDYTEGMKNILSDTDRSEAFKERAKVELISNTEKTKAKAIASFDSTLEQLRTKLHALEGDWKNADSSKLASTLSLIQMGVQPADVMIKCFQGDLVSMDVLSAALKKNNLYDSTEAYRIPKGIDYTLDDISYNFGYGVKDISGYTVNAAENGIAKLANIIGCEYEKDSIDSFISAARKGGGLIE